MAMLEVSSLTKRFGGLTAVNSIDFIVERGEIVSIIGPNGAGKTTVFNLITGIYPIDEGEIRFEGQSIVGSRPQEIVESGISRTFQNIRLFKKLRVIENVLVGTHVQTKYGFWDALLRTRRYRTGERESTQKAIDILESIGLGDYVDHYAVNLPYGLQRRLEIVRAIATGAKILLLDEPAAGMNPQESEELMTFIFELRDKGYTILLIEHDMNVVMKISDRIYVMDYGKVIASGVADEVATNEDVIRAYLGGEDDDA